MDLKNIAFVFATLFATAASAFNVDGFRSGMTTQELRDLGASRGLELKSFGTVNYFLAKPDSYQIDATFVVCNDRAVSYNRSIDFDADYFNILTEMLERHGQPKVQSKRIPVSYAAGQYTPVTLMRWHVGSQDRIDLTFSPETRDGKGALRFYRSASIRYSVQNSCTKDD